MSKVESRRPCVKTFRGRKQGCIDRRTTSQIVARYTKSKLTNELDVDIDPLLVVGLSPLLVAQNSLPIRKELGWYLNG